MVNLDYGFQLKELSRRVTMIEEHLEKLNNGSKDPDKEWDNATLVREWRISKRTAANYRQQGLEYYKRGGLVYYSPESRKNFIKIRKN